VSTDPALAELLARWAEAWETSDVRLDPGELAAGRPDLVEPLRRAIARYQAVEGALAGGAGETEWALAVGRGTEGEGGPLPTFEGFRTIERIGAGGMGAVYKVEDRKLGRTVAAKILRPGSALGALYGDFLREARALALFEDPRIVRVYEVRPEADPPVLLMEHVEGFELGRIGPSLSFEQRARVMAEICEAIDRAHGLGLTHRDLKPANILLTPALAPKILDFGLASGDSRRGRGLGTLPYAAPEQLAEEGDIDARTDVYALGVVLYELLCGERPFTGASDGEILEAIRAGEPRLPAEVDPAVPEPLQAIALEAMARQPEDRYPSAREMARDLRRYLAGRPVLARPAAYGSALARRLTTHLGEIRDWLDLKLIYPHEAAELAATYRRLEQREDDWIVRSRRLSPSQIALYVGVFLLAAGGLFYFGAHRLFGAELSLLHPLLALALPLLGLNVAGLYLERRDLRALAVAFYLGAAALLPVLLLVLLAEAGLWPAGAEDFFAEAVSNRQLQVATLATCAWTLWMALRTRTVGLASLFAASALLATLALTTDLGLEGWITDGRWDLLALHLLPLLAFGAGLGRLAEVGKRPFLARPLYLGGAGLLVLILELLALDGRALAFLGLTFAAHLPPEVSNPLLLDTVVAMTAGGVLIYLVAVALEGVGSELLAGASRLLYLLTPFAVLEPAAWLVSTGEYDRTWGWIYLALALGLAAASQHRQRKSFFYAGLGNTGLALYLLAERYEWFDAPAWAVALLVAGLLGLGLGVAFELTARNRRGGSPPAGEGS